MRPVNLGRLLGQTLAFFGFDYIFVVQLQESDRSDRESDVTLMKKVAFFSCGH